MLLAAVRQASVWTAERRGQVQAVPLPVMKDTRKGGRESAKKNEEVSWQKLDGEEVVLSTPSPFC